MDIGYPFRVNVNGGIHTTRTYEEGVSQSILYVCRTTPGDDPLNPALGLPYKLFYSIRHQKVNEKLLEREIKRWVGDVNQLSEIVIGYEQNHLIINFAYSTNRNSLDRISTEVYMMEGR